MFLKKFSLLAFLLQISLGQICMMQMASAQDMASMHGAHCENCSPDMNADKEMPMGMDCGTGHCLMHAKNTEQAVMENTNPSFFITLPPSPEGITIGFDKTVDQPTSTAPPDTPHTDTKVVLRF